MSRRDLFVLFGQDGTLTLHLRGRDAPADARRIAAALLQWNSRRGQPVRTRVGDTVVLVIVEPGEARQGKAPPAPVSET